MEMERIIGRGIKIEIKVDFNKMIVNFIYLYQLWVSNEKYAYQYIWESNSTILDLSLHHNPLSGKIFSKD
ncbi:hypothetical protein BpHYR1_051769 [Brachionus plicatilis]|uniref:Uncharacterized protein n=1 Tax=Brachionus plicatilis TaxID=10195 RepID=A0A3M7R6E6_BRAPC|nr:hypothetical protein BpHYR1_051769 [Brachionus plicatilis]